jgi:hypothetical protein
MSGDERREEYRRLQGIIHSFFVLQDYNLKIVINKYFCDETENRRYLISKSTADITRYYCEADVCGFMNSLIEYHVQHYFKFNEGYENIQYLIKLRLQEIKKEKNHKKHMGKNKRVAKKDKNISTTGIVEGLDPVASAGVNEFETKNQKILGFNIASNI